MELGTGITMPLKRDRVQPSLMQEQTILTIPYLVDEDLVKEAVQKNYTNIKNKLRKGGNKDSLPPSITIKKR